MRRATAVPETAGVPDVIQAIAASGCEAIPVVDRSNGDVVVRQLVSVRDLPPLRTVEASSARGPVAGRPWPDLLAARGRRPGRFPTINPDAALADAWGLMSDAHLP